MSDDKQNQNPNDDDKEQKDEVTLDGETYRALLADYNRLSENAEAMEDKGTGTGDEDDIDKLADEGKKSGDQEQINLDELSQTELAHVLLKETQKMQEPLYIALTAMKLEREIDRLTAKPEYDKFWDNEKAIVDMATENPKLSIKDVYHLVVGDPSKVAAKEGDDDKDGDKDKDADAQRSRRQILSKLPTGEKPTGKGPDRDEDHPTTIKGAAGKAFDDLEMDKFTS